MSRRTTRRRFLLATAVGAAGVAWGVNLPRGVQAADPVPTWLAAPTVRRQSKMMIAGWEAEPGAFDNNIDRGAVTRTLLHNIYDRLVDRDMSVKSNQAIVGNLATEWTVSADARVYTFKIRPGVKFHDGTECDAAAIKFNIDRSSDANHPLFHRAGAGSLRLGYGNLDKVEAVDKLTLRITHKDPFADFLQVIAFGTYSIASPAAIEKLGNDEYPNQPVGTGPFKYVGREKGVSVTFERNPDYWGGAPTLDGFVVRPLPEALTRVTALLNGEVDWINAVHPDSIARVQASDKHNLEFAQLPNTWGYIPNHKEAPTNNVLIRRALSHAVDRQTLADDIMRGLAVPAKGTHAQGTPGYNPAIEGYSYDPDKAKALLAEAGAGSGLKLNVWIPAGGAGSPFGIQMNEFIQQNFKDVGIDATFQQQEFQTFQNNMANGVQADVSALQVGFSVDEFVNLQRMYRTDLQPPNGNTNPGWYSNPRVDDLLKQALGATDEEQRRRIYNQVQQVVVEDAAWIFVVHQKAARAWSKQVRGFVNPDSYMFSFRGVTLG